MKTPTSTLVAPAAADFDSTTTEFTAIAGVAVRQTSTAQAITAIFFMEFFLSPKSGMVAKRLSCDTIQLKHGFGNYRRAGRNDEIRQNL
jgi:hypothetical protein